MNKCVIITSYIEGDLKDLIGDFGPDFIMCADGGFDYAAAAGIKPDMLIGDFDSIKNPRDPEIETLVFPSEKDDTDTGICLQTALDRGYKDILIIGGLGGRLDHTMSNIQLITGKSSQADRIRIKDKYNSCAVLNNSSMKFSAAESKYISIFSMSESSTGVTTSGLKYPLKDAELTFGSTLGTSNEFITSEAEIAVKSGILLIILSQEK